MLWVPPIALRETEQGNLPDSALDDLHERVRGVLLCLACGGFLCRMDDGIVIDGKHDHTFANPHGIVFPIRCFSTVSGGRCQGPASAEFSWFRGCRWQILACGNCATHVGWRFSGRLDFFALISSRIKEEVDADE